MQQLYWGKQNTATLDQVTKVSADIKIKLENLRKDMRSKLKPITDEIMSWESSFESLQKSMDEPQIPFPLCERIRSISLYCNNSMVEVAKQVIVDALGICGPPPCDCSAVAFGSLAKGEATPFSDLEYLFLIAKHNDVSIKYFETLAVTSYFIIGNVQETKLKYMSIDELQKDKWFEDEAMNGFKIDGLSFNAGNIPTGNGLPGTRKNHLIGTPAELIERYKSLLDNPDPNPEHPGDLTDMLSYTREFYSRNNNSTLYKQFCESISSFTPNNERDKATLSMLTKDIGSYDFIPGESLKPQTSSHSLNLKTDIYRYPSIIIYDLKIIFGLKQQDDSWQTLSAMRLSGRLYESVYGCLLFLLCSAQYIRFSAYLHYNSQQDKISVLLQQEHRARHPSGSWHVPRSLLFKICLIITPTKLHITRSLSNLNILSTQPTFDKYTSAIGFYKIIEEPENVIKCAHQLSLMDIFTLYELSEAHSKLHDFEQSVILFQQLETSVLHTLFEVDTQLFCNKFGGMQKTIFHLNLNLALALIGFGSTETAELVLQRLQKYDMDPEERQEFEFVKVDILHGRGSTSQAMEHLEYVVSESEQEDNASITGEASQKQELKYRVKHARLLIDTGLHKKARKQLDAALKISQNIYGQESRHPSIAHVYDLLAEVEIAQRNFDTAERYLMESQQGFTADDQIHRHQFLLIELYMGRKDFKEALAHALKLASVVENPAGVVYASPHQRGKVYLLMGQIFLSLGKTVTARQKLEQANALLRIPIPDRNKNIIVPELEHSLYLMAECYLQDKMVLSALKCIFGCLSGLSVFISEHPSFNPSYFHDIQITLSKVLRLMWKEGELSIDSDDHKAGFRSCYIFLSNIYARKGNDKEANKCINEAEKYESN